MGRLMSSPTAATSNAATISSAASLAGYHQHRKPQQWQQQQNIHIPPAIKRRSLTLSIFPLLLSPLISSTSAASAEEAIHLEPYIDLAVGFTLLVPSSWTKVDKAGATALFEEGKAGSSNSIGVVVNPVRLSSLKDFGTPQFVADKLIQAERRKESTKQAEVIAATERLGRGGLPVYEFEYTVDSTRGGMKRIFSAAFVASKKLYLLNIAHSDRPDNPLDSETRMVLEQVLHSFDTTL